MYTLHVGICTLVLVCPSFFGCKNPTMCKKTALEVHRTVDNTGYSHSAVGLAHHLNVGFIYDHSSASGLKNPQKGDTYQL